MLIGKIHIDKLKPASYNPRKDLKPGDTEYEKLKRSILEFNCVEPIVWNELTGNVVGGHQRLKVLRELGYTEVDVSIVSLSLEKEKALNIALNKIQGDWDDDLLRELLAELDALDEFDIDLTGFSGKQIDNLLADFRTAEIREDNFDPAAAAAEIREPITKPGDIWQLGPHRLMCGDATKQSDIERLMNGNLAAMVFTDPPYNVAYEGGTVEKLTIQNDNMPAAQFNQFLRDSFTSMFLATQPGGAIYVCHADSEGSNFRGALQEAGWMFKQCLVWAKNQFVLGRQDYQWQHEPILYGWKPGAAHRFYGGRKQGTVIEEAAPIIVQQDDNGALLTFTAGIQSVTIRVPSFEVLQAGDDGLSTVWRFEKPLRNGEHPTMKPIGLCARAIQNSSRQGDIILDLFGGSGSTLIAAEQTGRSCFMVELDPVYCDVIIRRWEEFTGQKVISL